MLVRPFEKFGNIFGTISTKKGLNLLDMDAGVPGSYNLNVATISQTNVGLISGEIVGQHKSIASGGGMALYADENISLGSELIDLQAGKAIRLTIGGTLIEIDAEGYVSIDADTISLTGGTLSINMDDKIKLNTKEVEINGETSIKLKSAKIDLN